MKVQIMMNLSDVPQFSPQKTLKEISFDKANQEYMTHSSLIAVDFDRVAINYEKRWKLICNRPASVDALYFDQDYQFFIEFKNGNITNEVKKVKQKIRDSILMFCDITNTNMAYTRKNITFILVYNEDKPSRTHIKNHFSKKAMEPLVRFGLGVYAGSHFSQVYTLTKNEFNQFIRQLEKEQKNKSLKGKASTIPS